VIRVLVILVIAKMKSFKNFYAEACWDGYTQVGMKKKGKRMVPNCVPDSKGKIPKQKPQKEARGEDSKGHYRSTEGGAGMTAAGVAAHNRKTGGNLKTAVTGKVKAGSKAAARRKSFCARMSGVKGPMKDDKGRPTRKAMSLRRWKCS